MACSAAARGLTGVAWRGARGRLRVGGRGYVEKRVRLAVFDGAAIRQEPTDTASHAGATSPGAPAGEPLAYRLRIDLDETQSPVWRRLEVDADLYLDELHAVVAGGLGVD